MIHECLTVLISPCPTLQRCFFLFRVSAIYTCPNQHIPSYPICSHWLLPTRPAMLAIKFRKCLMSSLQHLRPKQTQRCHQFGYKFLEMPCWHIITRIVTLVQRNWSKCGKLCGIILIQGTLRHEKPLLNPLTVYVVASRPL